MTDAARDYVLHDLPPDLVDRSESLVELEELIAAWQAPHPHRVALHGLARTSRGVVLVTDPEPPWSFAIVVAAARAAPLAARLPWAVNRALELAGALDGRTVHRDLSQATVGFDASGRARLLPPIAALVRRIPRVGAGTIKGGLELMSPEVVLGTSVDTRSDVYQLGLLLRGMLGAPPPFRGPNATEIQVLTAIIRGDPLPSLHDLGIEVPEEIDRQLLRATSRDATERHASPAAFAEALAPFADASEDARAMLAGIKTRARDVMRSLLFESSYVRRPCQKSWAELTPEAAERRHCSDCDLSVERATSLATLLPLDGSCVFYDPEEEEP